MSPVAPERVLHALYRPRSQQADTQRYAIVDAARSARIYQGLLSSGADYVCLYRGQPAQDFREVAQDLVQLDPEAPFTHWVLSLGWGESWGIFLESSASMRELRRHFRRFLMVYNPAGTPCYFRYYDPRVLRDYLPMCHADELQLLFGPVDCYRMESEDGQALLEFSFVNGQLQQRAERFVAEA